MGHELEMALRALDLMALERRRLLRDGAHFKVLIYAGVPGGPQNGPLLVEDVILVGRGRQASLPLSNSCRMLFGYLARHQRYPLSAKQLALGMKRDLLGNHHGELAARWARIYRSPSRAAITTQVMRLRDAIQSAGRELALAVDPQQVIISCATVNNEVRYRLHAEVEWESLD